MYLGQPILRMIAASLEDLVHSLWSAGTSRPLPQTRQGLRSSDTGAG
jgi:hypothetical protein